MSASTRRITHDPQVHISIYGLGQTGKVKAAEWKHTGSDVAPLFGKNRNNDHPIEDKRRWEIQLGRTLGQGKGT